MKKLVVSLLVLVALFFVTAAYAEEEVPYGIPAVVHSEWMSLRAEPSVKAERLARISNDEEVIILVDYTGAEYRNGEYLYVYYAGNYGWVKESLLTKYPRHLVAADGNVKVYASPTMNVEITDHLSKGDRITILELYGDFYVVNFRTGSGFIRRDENVYIQEEAEYYTQYANVTWGTLKSVATLYALPDETSYPVAVYRMGDSVQIVSESGDFYVVLYGERYAYVRKDVVR